MVRSQQFTHQQSGCELQGQDWLRPQQLLHGASLPEGHQALDQDEAEGKADVPAGNGTEGEKSI